MHVLRVIPGEDGVRGELKLYSRGLLEIAVPLDHLEELELEEKGDRRPPASHLVLRYSQASYRSWRTHFPYHGRERGCVTNPSGEPSNPGHVVLFVEPSLTSRPPTHHGSIALIMKTYEIELLDKLLAYLELQKRLPNLKSRTNSTVNEHMVTPHDVLFPRPVFQGVLGVYCGWPWGCTRCEALNPRQSYRPL